jgi:hypothetical protein
MTVFLRNCISVIFAILALFAALLAIVFILGAFSGIAQDTIQNAREISKSFSFASGFVERFKSEHGRLPYENEFSEWAKTQPENISLHNMEIIYFQQQFPPGVIEKFGSPPINSYIIEYWRGEWFEYYASWVDASTLELDVKKLYFLGLPPFIDSLALFILSVLFGVISIYLWPRKTQ